MLIDAAMRALGDVAAREREAVRVFTPADPVDESSVPAAAPPDAYFVATDDRGRTLFTRGGSLTVRDGTLIDASGEKVLGYAGDGAPLQPLRVDPIDRALGFGKTVQIDADGSVSYERDAVDPRSRRRETHRVTIGKVALARFAPGTKLQPVDGRHLTVAAGIAPHLGTPGDGNFTELVSPQQQQQSAKDLDDALERMQQAYLAIDAIRVAGLAQDGAKKTAMDLLK